jgi:hypothetical protein
MSNGSPSNLHKSLRRQLDQGLRFFYSINSYKSRGNSFDDSLTTCNNGGNGSFDSNSSPLTVARSVSTSAPATEGLFGMRNNRAHTYCSPKSSCGLSQGSGQGPIGNGLNAQKFIAMMQTGSPTTPQRPLLASIFRSNNKSNNCPERFV